MDFRPRPQHLRRCRCRMGQHGHGDCRAGGRGTGGRGTAGLEVAGPPGRAAAGC